MKNSTTSIENTSLMTLTEEEAAALDWSSRPASSEDDESRCLWADDADEDLDPSDEDLYDED